MTRWRTRHRGIRSDRGAAAVEFAIVLVVLLLIIFAIIDFGRLLYVSQAVKSASREGARSAAIAGTTFSVFSQQVTDSVSTANALAAGGSDAPFATWTGGTSGQTSAQSSGTPCTLNATTHPSVSVSVTVDFKWLTPIGVLPGVGTSGLTGTLPVESTTTMRCE